MDIVDCMIFVYTTIEKLEQAEGIVEILLSEHLIACANIWPIHSMYVFNEKLVKANEIGILLKTTIECQENVYSRLIELHPYECPAIMTISVDKVHPIFMNWVHEQTGC